AQFSKAWAVPYPPIVGVILGIAAVGQTEITQYAVLNHEFPVVMGLWSSWMSTAIGIVRDTSQNVVFVHGSANGYVYDHGAPDGTQWTDAANAADGGTVAIAHGVVGSGLGYAIRNTKSWERLDATLRLLTKLTGRLFVFEAPTG